MLNKIKIKENPHQEILSQYLVHQAITMIEKFKKYLFLLKKIEKIFGLNILKFVSP